MIVNFISCHSHHIEWSDDDDHRYDALGVSMFGVVHIQKNVGKCMKFITFVHLT